MSLINGTPILFLLRGYRIAHFSGRFGSGKTAGAYRLAHDLLEFHGYRYIISNCHDIWSDDPHDIELRPGPDGSPTFMDAVLILDEAGIVFDGSARQAKQFVAFMRKFNVILLLPSVEAPPSRVRFLQIQRKYNFAALGVPLWWYETRLNTGMDREKYAWGWWNFKEIFGVYDTGDFPADDSGLGEWLQAHVEKKTQRRRKAGQREKSASREVPPMADGRGEADQFASAAEEISDAVSLLAEWGANRRKRRG
jgi:hypothetical protein